MWDLVTGPKMLSAGCLGVATNAQLLCWMVPLEKSTSENSELEKYYVSTQCGLSICELF